MSASGSHGKAESRRTVWHGTAPGKTASFLQVMTERIVKQFDPVQIILFGSFARGDARADSDVDLLVVLPAIENKHRAVVEIRRTLLDVPVAKDVFVTTPEEIETRGNVAGSILRPALREGKVLYERTVTGIDIQKLLEEGRGDPTVQQGAA